MRLDDYRSLASACDSVLRDAEANRAWVAISALHVLSEHPIHRWQYAGLMGHRHESTLRRLDQRLRSDIRRWGGLARDFVTLLRHGSRASTGSGIGAGLPSRLDVLLVSCLVSPDHTAGDQGDFYFGDVPNRFADRGLEVGILLRNLTGQPSASLVVEASPCPRVHRRLLPDQMSLRAELEFWRRGLRARGELTTVWRRESEPLRRAVLREAMRQSLSSSLLHNLRFSRQIGSVVQRCRPGLLITLYEGHGWERLAYRAAREASPSTVCAGYQHTVVRRHAHALRRSLGERYDPDLVLTMGGVTHRNLESTSSLPHTCFQLLGSQRRGDAAEAVRPLEGPPTFLVIPEGYVDESVHLFRYAIAAARARSDWRFLLRTHPMLPFRLVRPHLADDLDSLANIEISTQPSIDAEFDRAHYCIYRGSSGVVYAILRGLRPFHVARPGSMDIDPLLDLDEWRCSADSVADLERLVDADSRLPQAARDAQWAVASDYCHDYAVPLRDDAIVELARMATRQPAAPCGSCR